MPLFGALLAACIAFPAAAQETKFQTIQVQPGETLWGIASRYLKDPAQWSEIARYNAQIGSDPTVVLPGMKIRVPLRILKPSARAAELTAAEERVEHRAQEGGDWRPAKLHMPLYPGNWLKTGSMSRARIKFPYGEVLNLESHSLVVIDPPNDEGKADLRLVEGKLKALNLKMQIRDVAVVPRSKNAVFEMSIEEGKVKVDVYAGEALVSANGSAVALSGGQTVDVPEGRGPRVPEKFTAFDPMTRAAAEKRQAAGTAETVTTDIGDLDVDLKNLPVGMTLAGFRLQASKTEDFAEVVLERVFEPEERVTVRNLDLPAGVYWWRVAPVDLLGASGKFSKPKRSALR
ncbi:MAG: LysM peptidoglycan-binding domain-containing protein [Elusimicrobia bacterium]|nr:LysM peptidoglycan-binding domain-containing protein [Elusimicrobiota bacterium]